MERIAAFGREHPDRIFLYCTNLVHQTRLASKDLSTPETLTIIEGTTELAARLDRPGRSCSAQFLAAVPHTPEAVEIVDEARGYCWASKPVCNRIRLPESHPPTTPPGAP